LFLPFPGASVLLAIFFIVVISSSSRGGEAVSAEHFSYFELIWKVHECCLNSFSYCGFFCLCRMPLIPG
jgi:hypothetical protein